MRPDETHCAVIRKCGHSAIPCFGEGMCVHTGLGFQSSEGMWQNSCRVSQKVGRWAVTFESHFHLWPLLFLLL